MPLLFLLLQVLPGPLAGEDLSEQINGFAQLQELDQKQLNELQSACQQQPAAAAQLIPRLSCHELYLVASAIAGCEIDSAITDALVSEALRRPQPTTALACLLAPRRVPITRLPDLAKMALNPGYDLALRSAALVRLLEHGCVSAWPVARSVLLSGTARDRMAPWASWERSGKYELPKRILKVEIEALIRHLSPVADSIPELAFEPNGPWQAQVDACTELEIWLLPLLSSAGETSDFSHHSRQQQQSFQRAVGLMLQAGDDHSLQAVTLLLPHALPTLMAALANQDLELASAARRCMELKPH